MERTLLQKLRSLSPAAHRPERSLGPFGASAWGGGARVGLREAEALGVRFHPVGSLLQTPELPELPWESASWRDLACPVEGETRPIRADPGAQKEPRHRIRFLYIYFSSWSFAS